MQQSRDMLMAINRTIKLYDAGLGSVRKAYGLSRIEVTILSFLHNNPDQDTVGEIADIRMLSKGNVSRGADLLLQKGYISRVQDQKDRRWVHLKLEAAADPLLADIDLCAQKFEQLLFRDFTPEEREAYRRLNAKCFANVHQALEEGKD